MRLTNSTSTVGAALTVYVRRGGAVTFHNHFRWPAITPQRRQLRLELLTIAAEADQAVITFTTDERIATTYNRDGWRKPTPAERHEYTIPTTALDHGPLKHPRTADTGGRQHVALDGLQHALPGHSKAVGGLLHRHQRRQVHRVGEAVEIGGGEHSQRPQRPRVGPQHRQGRRGGLPHRFRGDREHDLGVAEFRARGPAAVLRSSRAGRRRSPRRTSRPARRRRCRTLSLGWIPSVFVSGVRFGTMQLGPGVISAPPALVRSAPWRPPESRSLQVRERVPKRSRVARRARERRDEQPVLVVGSLTCAFGWRRLVTIRRRISIPGP